jgi:hypothetical protein
MVEVLQSKKSSYLFNATVENNNEISQISKSRFVHLVSAMYGLDLGLGCERVFITAKLNCGFTFDLF